MLNLLAITALTLGLGTAAPTNTTCPVMGDKVNEKSPVVTVKGKGYRICCKGCEAKLKKNPGKYLKADGTPKNAK
jgi:YHS domain-containing protein